MDLTDLTYGERLLLSRLRQGKTQVEMAQIFNVSVDKYRSWETDTAGAAPRATLRRVRPHEACRLRRLRAGKTQREVAQAMGISRLWVHKMERGEAPVRRLASFWGLP